MAVENYDILAPNGGLCCALEGDLVGGAAECCPSLTAEVVDVEGVVGNFLDWAETQCGGLTTEVEEECSWGSSEGVPFNSGLECVDVDVLALGGDTRLTINPAESFVSVSSPAIGSVSSKIAGSGGLSVSPAGFLRAYGTGTAVSSKAGKLTDVELFLLGDAMVWQNNGYFYLPSAQINDIWVQGLLAGSPTAWKVSGTGSPATGRVLPSQGTWYLDYSSTAGGTAVRVHLEGNAIPL